MTLRHLIVQEIRHRPGIFALGAGLTLLATLAMAGSLLLLRGYDRETERLAAAASAETAIRMQELEDRIRVSMKGLGFNIHIFPEGQDLAEVYERGFAVKTMPEEYVDRLAGSDIVTVNHLLPSLTRRVNWEQAGGSVLLVGIRGEVPLRHRHPLAPLLEAVPAGHLVLGHSLHQRLGAGPGETTQFFGRAFTIHQIHEERGSADDLTVWMNLSEAQELLGMPGRISAILALECNCESADRIGEVRAELLRILPGTQIIEKQSQALARAEARLTAKTAAEAQLEALRDERARQRAAWTGFASVSIPLLALLALGGIGLLTVLNVRARWPEIAVLRAVGLSSRSLLTLFVGKALIAGLVGSLLGILLALLLPWAPWLNLNDNFRLLHPGELAAILFGAPLLAALAALPPAFIAAQQDPCNLLRHD
ncbi:MAG TPA: FtsX-like permease family protein [Verrucomicrobiales bacterium]|nr:FtsX-like permease family protein [Verrucomicrobiales bacterium]